MEKVINSYESLFIVNVTKGDEVVEATVNKFVSLIEANAEIVDVAKWGKRRLAYAIDDMPEGYYVVVTYKTSGEFPSEFERLCNIDETVMRSMTLKLEYDAAAKKAAKAATKAADETVAEEAPAVEEAVEEAPAAEATDAE
ncbi:MAG: 30S ribosomal protein S6 [Clostridia bacterium]|nr:30S ribosomal protein S6 [Clostridia bacterium]